MVEQGATGTGTGTMKRNRKSERRKEWVVVGDWGKSEGDAKGNAREMQRDMQRTSKGKGGQQTAPASRSVAEELIN